MGDIEKADRIWRRALTQGTMEIITCQYYQVGASYSHHRRALDEHICNFIIEGSHSATVAGETVTLPAGSVLWVPANEVHDFALTNERVPFRMINTRWRLWHGTKHVRFTQPLLWSQDRWDLRPMFDILVDDYANGHPEADLRFRNILSLLYTDLIRENTEQRALSRHQRLALIHYAQAHVQHRPTTADLAQVVNLSTDYFRRIFRQTFSCSPAHWLLRQRMHSAAQALLDQPHTTITTIAEQFGYEEIFVFSKQFKQILGCSPRAWRLRH